MGNYPATVGRMPAVGGIFEDEPVIYAQRGSTYAHHTFIHGSTTAIFAACAFIYA